VNPFPGRRALVWLLRATPWIVACVIILVSVIHLPAFRRAGYWLTLTRLYFAPAVLALVLTPIILTGGIDLSVGSVTVFASVVIGALAQRAGWAIGWAMLGGLLAGLGAGIMNGALITVGVMPLVATLATRELFRGAAYTLVGDAPLPGQMPEPGGLWRQALAGLPLAVFGIAVLFVLVYLIVHHTWIGRMVYALGDNEQAARFAGVPVRGLKLGLYAGSGLVAGLCGAALVMEYHTAKADAEKSLELVAIAGVVLGGVRITGGAGHVAGTLLGIVTITVLWAALTRVASDWRETITGVILIAVAVANETTARWSATGSAPDG
jgi:ribose/xylose/arabinose/galactoside ABC-type transport system permease subunit